MTFLRFDSAVNSLTSFVVRTACFLHSQHQGSGQCLEGEGSQGNMFLGRGVVFLMKELLNSYVEIFSRGKNFLVQEDQGTR